MNLDDVKPDKRIGGWKKFSEHGWKDKDLREAVTKAWKDGDKLVESAMGYNNMKWKKVNDGWKKISNKSLTVPTRCPISNSHRQLLLGTAMAAPRIDCALITEEVRREFGRCIDLSFLPKECKPVWREKCFSTYQYRKIDGTCNNKIHPTWGKSGTPFIRMIEPDYADGVSAIRTAKDGGPLPNARLLSRKLYSKRTKPDSDTSVLFMYLGLLIDHDMAETAVNTDAIPCCDEDFIAHPQARPKECLQIDIAKDDPFYGPKNVVCLNLIRSVPVNGVCAGRREQLNKATSLLDGSVVYGSAIGQAKQLRTFSRGQLRTQLINNTPFMAYAEGAGYSCGTPNEPLKCFEAGDSRVNMMVELTAMHTLWYREHNRIANELHKLNPQYRDEMLFQEARKILIGELQHITYNEFLPLLLGKKAVEDFEIKIDESKPYEGYDDTIDPSLFNVFGAAAFRFGHSLVPDMQYLLGPNNSTHGKVPLHETFFNTKILYHDGIDVLLRGAASQRTQTVDSYVSPEVREHLFQPSGLDYGYDLAAVGVQRGRDHGLPPYTKWRSVCGLSEVKTWEDLHAVMDKDRADMFKDVYQSVDDIDLIPGALAEHHEQGSLVGPTYTCLIGRQFKKSRKGDRFWYEIQNEIGSFTPDQLQEIYKSSMARIVCDNSDNIKEIQRDPLKVPSSHNVLISCDAVPKIDLSKWISNF